MRLLELFAGTGSVGDVFRERGWEVVSLDRDMPATFRCDILDWDHTVLPPGHFTFIWASPPCTEYSRAKTVGIRKLKVSNRVGERTLELINYFQPTAWAMENPQTGLLKWQECVALLPYVDLDYCKYGLPYRKRTRLWTNVTTFVPRPLCRYDCPASNPIARKHAKSAQQGAHGADRNRNRTTELYRVPADLVCHILDSLPITSPVP